MKKAILLIICVMIVNILSGSTNDTIKSVQIGNQVWMLENLNVSRFRNGDPIPEAKTDEEWAKARLEEKPAWCYFKNDPENGKKFGKLYNWYAVNDTRGLAPEGWHIPGGEEVTILSLFVYKNGNALKAIGQGTGEGAGTNSSGFSALIAGGRYINNSFSSSAHFWTSLDEERFPSPAWSFHLLDNNNSINYYWYPKEICFSVRCINGEGPIKEAKPDYKASHDTTFNNGSNIILNNLSRKDQNALTILGKLWGFLKYYHPATSKGDLNWDYELFRVMPKVLNCTLKEDRNKILAEWINSLGGIKEKQELLKIYDKSKIKLMPDLKWTEDESELGKDIVAQLKDIKIAKRDSSNYYSINGQRSVPSFDKENPYKKMAFPDVGFRLLSLFRYWNIIQYYFPYKNLIEDNWNQVLRDFIPGFVESSNELEYRLTINKLAAKIHDSHVFIRGNDQVLLDYYGKYRIPCKISFIENKAVVTEVYSKADSTIKLKIGDIITKVDGESVDKIVKRKLPIYSASNYPTKLRNIAFDILRSNNESISITFSRQGGIKKDNVKCVKMENIGKYIPRIEKKSWEMMDNNIGYIYPGSLKNSELPEMMKYFQKCKGIIIDFRCYPSDGTTYTLGEYLMPAPIQFVKFTQTNFEMPGMFLFQDPRTVGTNNPDYYKGKVIIIVNETTQSAAEFASMAFRKAPKATVIGSTTAGADGVSCFISLPGGISTRFTGLGVYYPDGRETQRIGIVPDIVIKPTIEGIKQGKDEVLDKAIEVINGKVK